MAEKKVKKTARKGIKNVRKSKKRHLRNLKEKTLLKKLVKETRKAIAAKTADVKEKIQKAISFFDKLAQRKIIHANKAARLKSRIIKAFNKVK
ncbi:hypothetical protein A2311_05615 [candidate division WOR-1 bacterium RIFOXYB2_FULL_48_7]|uniref:Small ribosomal subunit protein bS20 n=1 Tax=candidate division WOR-1 bacterium RIFOXYB2_FULL_48_7 TaxID=1802583 RepID=A0A1F4TR43_UNCSA|nr:MAG: hypothetical protein A2311_05615 [candidate division WOR-1 bacterium RIFOXYB2_FULL_48_7]